MRRTRTRDDVIEQIRELAAGNGGRPPPGRGRGVPQTVAVRLFGSWSAAVEAAGFPRPKNPATRRRGGPRTPHILNPAERAEAGFVAVIRDALTGRLEVQHRLGPPKATMREFVAELDMRPDGDWRLLTYSTPNTIRADLLHSSSFGERRFRQMPEVYLLGQIGRMDRLDDSIRPRTRARRRTRRKSLESPRV